MPERTLVRIGIDVGGTFTHAVAVKASTLEVLGKARVPTTHGHEPRGVAEGVVLALRQLLLSTGVRTTDVAFVAHSTTQATNALLEGDVALVGVLAVGHGLEGRRVREDTNLQSLDLQSTTVPVLHRYVARDRDGDLTAALRRAISELEGSGATAIVAAEAFSVDDPAVEQAIVALAREAGLAATGTHEVSGLYGLRARTRTAAVNASIMPEMMRAATATERGLRDAGVTAPLMVVRSDGGVMGAEEMARRPILTLLSGPAAGVAAAVTHLRIADGVFVDVGGTSTDISAVVDGRPRERTAVVGGHRLHLRTLEIRTIGVAGGSLPRVRRGAFVGVGPRSAHKAGLRYVSFDEAAVPRNALLLEGFGGGGCGYLALTDGDSLWAFTLTCARRTLDGSCSEAPSEVAGRFLGMSGPDLCRAMLETAGRAAAEAITAVADEAGLSGVRRRIVGGGGGCSALLPSAAEALGADWHECADADVISAIGAARAVLRESVERHLPHPTADALAELRREAVLALQRMGADPSRVEVEVVVDSAAGTARAVASGPTELDATASTRCLTDAELEQAARSAAGLADSVALETVATIGPLHVFCARRETRGPLGLGRRKQTAVIVVDEQGRVRLQRDNAWISSSTVAAAAQAIESIVEYGDHGMRIPPTRLVAGGKLVDLSGVPSPAQAIAVIREELRGQAPDSQVVFIRG